MHNFSEENIFIFLIQIFLLLGLARGLGELFRRWKQPALSAEILVGVLLGPTIFGRLVPDLYHVVFPANAVQQGMLETIAWLGLLFFLLEAGLKMDFSMAWRHRGKALTIALVDIIVPMTIAFISCLFLPARYLINPDQRLLFALFMATVMTISAMPITIRVLSDLNVIKTDLGYLIMSALSVNEVIGWMVFTVILNFFIHANAAIGKIAGIFIITISFIIFCLTAGRRFADFIISKIRDYELPEPGSSLTFICLLGFLCGAVLQRVGVQALLGFFIAGIMAGESRALPERTRQVISQMVYAIFIPLFFAGIGLNIDFLKSFNIFLALLITLVGIFGKFLGAWLGARFTRLSKVNRLSVAIAHTPGGSMEIVIGILALKYSLITEPVFVAIVFGGVVSSVVLGPWLKYAISRRKEIGILEFFSPRTIILDTKACDSNSAIHELCVIVSEQENVPNAGALYSAVLKRENAMGTAIEESVALPHARLPSLVKPVVAFGRSRAGIEWNSPDGKPTHFIFLILTSQEDDWAQVQILRIIAKTMSDKSARAAIMSTEDHRELWNILEQAFTSHTIVNKKQANSF